MRRRAAGLRAVGLAVAQPQGAERRPSRTRDHRSHLAAPAALLQRGRHLSVKFTPPGDTVDDSVADKAPALRGSTRQSGGAPKAAAADWTQSRIDLVRTLSEASARARRREHASAYLRGVGLQVGNRHPRQRQPQEHLARAATSTSISIIAAAAARSPAGPASIRLTGPWEVNFRTTEAANANTLQLVLSVQGLVPRGLARSVPQLAVLEGARYAGLGRGPARRVERRRGAERHHRHRHGARHDLRCRGWRHAADRRRRPPRAVLQQRRAPLRHRAVRARLGRQPRAVHRPDRAHAQGAEGPRWVYDIKSAGGWLGAEPPIHQRITIDDWRARGFLLAGARRASCSASSRCAPAAPRCPPRATSPTWPAPCRRASRARSAPCRPRRSSRSGRACWRPSRASGWGGIWCAAACRAARSGSPPAAAWPAPIGARRNSQRVSLALEGSDLAFSVLDGWPTLEMPRGLVRLEGDALEITAPDAVHERGRRPPHGAEGLAHGRHDPAAAAHRPLRVQGAGAAVAGPRDGRPGAH